jgi:RNA polymerase-binding transcription factor DksA
MKTSNRSPADLARKTQRTIRHQAMKVDRLMKQRKWLLRLRENLLEEIQQLTAEAREENPNYSMHPADAGTDSFDRDLVLGLASFHNVGIYEIDAALKRIEDGTYGICELTGQKIPWERLEAIPWTRFTMEAERQVNRNFHPHLGPLKTLRPVEARPVENASEDVVEEETQYRCQSSPEDV